MGAGDGHPMGSERKSSQAHGDHPRSFDGDHVKDSDCRNTILTEGFGGKDNRKENRQGCFSNLITIFHNF